MAVKDIYAVQMKSSFSHEMTPYTVITTATRKKAVEYINADIWGDLHDIYDTWDLIEAADVPEETIRNIFGSTVNWEDTVLLQRRKTGEIVMYYVDRIKYLY